MKGLTKYLILTVLVVVIAACSQGSAILAPPEIHFGEDVCADCGMIISDPRFASAYAFEIEPGRYQNVAFDDMGDMVHFIKNNPDKAPSGAWAHDYASEEWLVAEAAWYVVSSEIRSPMGHGIAAFGMQAGAQALAAELGVSALDWDHMRAEVLLHAH